MKKLNIHTFAGKLNTTQVLDNKSIQKIKGGQGDPPPWGNEVASDPPPFGADN